MHVTSEVCAEMLRRKCKVQLLLCTFQQDYARLGQIGDRDAKVSVLSSASPARV